MSKSTQTPQQDVPVTNPEGTQPETTVENPAAPAEEHVDYQKKFSESTREAQRLYEENKALKAKLESDESKPLFSDSQNEGTDHSKESADLPPEFQSLDEESKKNLIAYTNSLQKNVLNKVYKDPAISHSKTLYNENLWDKAFNNVISEYPDLAQSRDEFKAKYFKADNVPSNIDSILKDVAKIYLFDKAQDIGAQKAREQADRIENERMQSGDKTPKASRTLEDWNQLSKENPAKFASMAKEFNEDLTSGKLK